MGTTAAATFVLVALFLSLRILCYGADDSTTVGLTRCREDERKALLHFKRGVQDPYGRLSSWVDDDCCSWLGVECDDNSHHVIRLDLSDASLAGRVAPQLGNLSALRYLLISGLHIDDDVSWLSHLSSLRCLDLDGVNIKNETLALQHLGMLPSLSELHLIWGSLTSDNIPVALLPDHVNFTSLTLLNLAANFLQTKIPRWLFQIRSLRHLYLCSNMFFGHIPVEISNLSSLEVLNLDGNELLEGGILAAATSIGKVSNLRTLSWSNRYEGFYGGLKGELPLWLGELRKLETLDLSGNQLNGTLSSIFDQLGSLVVLDLTGNNFDGVLNSSHFKKLTSLRYLRLSHNSQLKVDIGIDWVPPPLIEIALARCKVGPAFPKWLQKMDNISDIDMSGAQISDTMPGWFWTFSSNLRRIDLSNNTIQGELPNSLTHLPNLIKVDISQNQLKGPLPQFSAKLESLKLQNNSISGSIPSNMGEMMYDIVELDVSQNKLSGNIPSSICKMKKLDTIDLSHNQLTGDIPNCLGKNQKELTGIEFSNNMLSGTIPDSIWSLSQLVYLSLGHNNLSGNLPSATQNCTRMQFLSLGHNNIRGYIPTWIAKNLTNLERLNLRSNMFVGEIPSEICSPYNLRALLLGGNSLSGVLPLSLKNCTQMSVLDLGDNKLEGQIPSRILENMYGLLVLSLRSNMFAGEIPTELGTTPSRLKVIDLSHNMLSGPIPQDFAYEFFYYTQLTVETFGSGEYFADVVDVVTKERFEEYQELQERYPISIDLSYNNLSGEIPESLTILDMLQNLNLSNNHFNGVIPWDFGKLRSLESLDLSLNNLTGEIPQSITQLNFLSVMNFSFNNFSGMIPVGGQFYCQPEPSIYMGNALLHVFPCERRESPQSTRKSDESKGNHQENNIWFDLGMAPGFVIGFWAFIGALLIKMKWRIAYYRCIDNAYGRFYVLVEYWH